MRKTIQLSAFALMTTSLFIGCGSSDSTSSGTGTNTGYFIDSAVQGAQYSTSSGLSGTTDAFGKFNYNTGDTVKFHLGKMVLGETQPSTDGKITPKTLIADTLAPDTNETASISLLLRMLQSMDSDGNTTNGITIDPAVITDLEKLDSEIHFEDDVDESYLITLDNNLSLGLDEDYDGHLDVNETEAEDHFKETETKWENGEKPDDEGSEESKKQKGKGSENGQGNGSGHGEGNGSEHGEGNGSENNNSEEHGSDGENGGSEFNLDDYNTTSNLSIDIKKSLAYMGNEERLAYDVYNKLGSTFTDIKQFTNIASKSEIKHIQGVQKLIQRYDINGTELSDGNFTTLNYQDKNITDMTPGVYGVSAVQNLYNTLIAEGNVSKEAALKVGCKIEVVDVNDLDKYITAANDANASDVKATFDVLRSGSYKHYWAFDKAIKQYNTTGCYYEGDSLLTNKAGIYPQD